MSVLVVEDDMALAEMVVDVIETEGVRCHLAHSLEEAVAAVRQHHPRLVLLDQHLPDGGGLDHVQQIKAAAQASVAIVIFSAGRPNPRTLAAMGADGFLAKPFDIEELLALVERYHSPH